MAVSDRVAGGAGELLAGWGRTRVLDRFQAEMGGREDAPVTLTVRVNGQDLSADLALQAQAAAAASVSAPSIRATSRETGHLIGPIDQNRPGCERMQRLGGGGASSV